MGNLNKTPLQRPRGDAEERPGASGGVHELTGRCLQSNVCVMFLGQRGSTVDDMYVCMCIYIYMYISININIYIYISCITHNEEYTVIPVV